MCTRIKAQTRIDELSTIPHFVIAKFKDKSTHAAVIVALVHNSWLHICLNHDGVFGWQFIAVGQRMRLSEMLLEYATSDGVSLCIERGGIASFSV